jgi:hypothetical protein
MRRLLAALPATLLLAPAAAHGAAVQTDRGCYLQTPGTTVTVSGNGYTAGSPYTVTLDGTALTGGGGTMDAGGAMQGAFAPPTLAATEKERTFSVAVQQPDALGASTNFTVTRFSAGFSPSKGDPAKLKVRFAVSGFGLGAANPDVYLHYVAPDGKLRQTVRLGRAQGPCGSIERTAKRRLFPFQKPTHGKWQLQFDTSRSYTHGVSGASPFLFFTVGVSVHSAPAKK